MTKDQNKSGRLNASRVHLTREIAAFASGLEAGSRVLDAGAGDCRYRSHFEHCRYESADFVQVKEKTYGSIDHVCDLAAIPLEDGRFDAILCTQVLAHSPEPLRVLSELRRVLRPGGRLLLTCPLFFHENEAPYDFFRYTQYGLRHLLGHAGFSVESLSWLEGYCGTLSYQLNVAAHALRSRPADFGGGVFGGAMATAVLLWRPGFRAMAYLLYKADLRHKVTERGQCKNYAVVAIAGDKS